MPNYKGHLVGGVAAFLLVKVFLLHKIPEIFATPEGELELLKELIACLLGSLAPDIDIYSKGKQILSYGLLCLIIIGLMKQSVVSILIFLAIFVFATTTTHRGVTHNPIFVIFSPFLLINILNKHVAWLPNQDTKNVPFYFVVGALSHIILDALPKSAFVFFQPKSKYPKRDTIDKNN